MYTYKIEYTDRTWATDIAGLLGNHGKKLVESHTKIKTIIRDYHEEIIIYTGLIMSIACLLIWVNYSKVYIDELTVKTTKYNELYVYIVKLEIGNLPPFHQIKKIGGAPRVHHKTKQTP